KRPRPKVWAASLRPSDLGASIDSAAGRLRPGASAPAVQSHYDVSNDFYGLWLGPTMMYTSGMWSSADNEPADLDSANLRKIDFFAARVGPSTGGGVLGGGG